MLHPGPAVHIWACANFKWRPLPSEQGNSPAAQVAATLKGHFDYSFAVAWHPDGNCFATGNQVGNAVLRLLLETADKSHVPRPKPCSAAATSQPCQQSVRKFKFGTQICMRGAQLVTGCQFGHQTAMFWPQDTTTRVWDVRMTGRGSVAVLKGRIGAIRSLRYSPCGRVLAVAEPADFITLYDAAEGYEQAQEVSP